ncbi:hypothetical protein BU14_0407s0008 [Porphyra umbilicalis]|uniref:Uncharacterized protein n=1 Tax=Porphyra umbilicalis TaxID=2786 RepID=A0A1X6NWI5_PORUM|nr:hypothetical protein BU14_0407s0008 [Porphyra umbilicalis]|eukprot:OSX72743.1 hypothetical protein BU14_0407s0008 [Porphyra umbilicalis]
MDRAGLAALRAGMRDRVGRLEAAVGFAQAGLRFWAAALAERDDAPFRDAGDRVAAARAAADGRANGGGGRPQKKAKRAKRAKRLAK